MRKMDWITSAKPEADPDLFLEQNCLLSGFHHPDCRLLVVNGLAEKDSLPALDPNIELVLVDSQRPTLHELLSLSQAEVTILSNADVRVFAKQPLNQTINPQAALSVSRRYDLEFAEIPDSFAEADTLTRTFGYLQSRFTIDLFVVSKAFLEHLLLQPWTREYCLGQAGVDMHLLNEAYGFGKVDRLDRRIRLLHRNHEPFKVALPVNIIVDMAQNRSFSEKRGAAFSGEAVSMILASLPGAFSRIKFLKRNTVRLDMQTVRLRNRFQFWWSRVVFRWASRFAKTGAELRLSHLGKLWFFTPARAGTTGIALNADEFRAELRRHYLRLLRR